MAKANSTGLVRTKSEQLVESMVAALKSPPSGDHSTDRTVEGGGGGTLSRKSSRRMIMASPGRAGGKNTHIRKSRSAQISQLKFELDELNSGAALSRASSASLGFSFSFTGFTMPPDEIADSKPFSDDDIRHPWVQEGGLAPDKPLDSAVLSRVKQFSAMNKLKKIAIRVIAESLSEEEIAGLKEMFRMIDVDNSGHITLEELKNGLERVGANLKDSEILWLMEAADIDNSGTIDYGEFIAAMLHLNKVQKEDHLYAAFSYFDQDGSGYITREELQKAYEKFGMLDVHLDDIIREVDQDNDGLIDYNEFAAMMQDSNFGKLGLQLT